MNVCTYCIYPQDTQLPDVESVPFHILRARAKQRGHTNAWLIACVKNAEQMGLHWIEYIINSVIIYVTTCALTRKHTPTNTSNKHTHIKHIHMHNYTSAHIYTRHKRIPNFDRHYALIYLRRNLAEAPQTV